MSGGVWKLQAATPSTNSLCSIVQLQTQPSKERSKPNSEDYSPACSPSNIPPKTQQSTSVEKESTNLENLEIIWTLPASHKHRGERRISPCLSQTPIQNDSSPIR
ncbi:hypothetical protein ILYODFUR_035325 [Ilyodon furcidens]|uniref:Uncharacterized protein n=1 Tax=Ilyodon furcidens TaxID=33524 RepID=A0ABV0UEZ6_9TELE